MEEVLRAGGGGGGLPSVLLPLRLKVPLVDKGILPELA
jgi:hypothetical protein